MTPPRVRLQDPSYNPPDNTKREALLDLVRASWSRFLVSQREFFMLKTTSINQASLNAQYAQK